MTVTFRFITSLWLAAGLGLVGVAAAVRVVVWARSEGTACPDGLRELLEWMAAAGSAAMALRLGAMLRAGSGDPSACAATAAVAASGLALGWWGVRRSEAATDQRFAGACRRPNGAGFAVAFPNYTQIAGRIPVRVWQALRASSLVGGPEEEAIVLHDPAAACYRKLVVADGRVVGAILLGAGSSVTAMVRAAITCRTDVTGCLPDLRAGWWDALA